MTINHTVEQLPPRIAGAIRSYLWSRSEQRPVSVARILHVTRYAFPDIALSDEELAELIVQELILEGCDVDFDRDKPDAVTGPVIDPSWQGGGIERAK